MITLSRDRLLDIAKFFIHKLPPAGDEFQNMVGEFYKKSGDTPEGMEIKKQFEKAFSDKAWKTDLSEKDMITLAKKINYAPLYHAIAARLSPNKRNEAFPELKDKFEAVAGAPGSPGVGTTTTTANTAPYPIPLGSMMRREDPTKKKKKKKEKPKKRAKKKGKL